MPRKQVIQLALSYSKRQVIQEVFFNENYVVLHPGVRSYESHDRGGSGTGSPEHEVRYYSFEMFREKIIDTGAEYIACDEYLMKPDRKLEEALKRSSTTAMSLNAIETTIRMNDRLTKDVTEYQPDLIVSDSVCFSGGNYWRRNTRFRWSALQQRLLSINIPAGI